MTDYEKLSKIDFLPELATPAPRAMAAGADKVCCSDLTSLNVTP